MEAMKVLRAVAVLGLALASYRLARIWWIRRLMGQRVASKVVLITGASSGLGEGMSPGVCVCVCTYSLCVALARAYHAAGAKVILAARNTHELERVKGQLDSVQVTISPVAPTVHYMLSRDVLLLSSFLLT